MKKILPQETKENSQERKLSRLQSQPRKDYKQLKIIKKVENPS